MERTVSDLEGRTAELDKEARDLRQENNFLKDLIMSRARSRRVSGQTSGQMIGQPAISNDDEAGEEDESGDENNGSAGAEPSDTSHTPSKPSASRGQGDSMRRL
jgi:hypothetical protein